MLAGEVRRRGVEEEDGGEGMGSDVSCVRRGGEVRTREGNWGKGSVSWGSKERRTKRG